MAQRAERKYSPLLSGLILNLQEMQSLACSTLLIPCHVSVMRVRKKSIEQSGRDRNWAHSTLGRELPLLLFRLQNGFLIPPWPMFPSAPLRSRTVGFPESGSDLG